MSKEQKKCSFVSCDNPASICFTCHGEECAKRFEGWKEEFIRRLKRKVHDEFEMAEVIAFNDLIDALAEEFAKETKSEVKG